MYDNDDVHYAQQRLAGTIIRHDSKAVEVLGVDQGERGDAPLLVDARYILGRGRVTDSIHNFDLTPVPLGFINYDGGEVGYLERKPMRKDWRQGLRRENAAFTIDEDFKARVWEPKSIAKTIEGVFLPLEQAIGKANGDGGKVAWHRHFAVDKDQNIFYRTYGQVGNFINKMDYLLDARFVWVEDRLKEALK